MATPPAGGMVPPMPGDPLSGAPLPVSPPSRRSSRSPVRASRPSFSSSPSSDHVSSSLSCGLSASLTVSSPASQFVKGLHHCDDGPNPGSSVPLDLTHNSSSLLQTNASPASLFLNGTTGSPQALPPLLPLPVARKSSVPAALSPAMLL